MNCVYRDLRAVFESYNAFDDEERDDLGYTVIRRTLGKLFVLDVLDGDARLDASVSLADGVEEYLVDPKRFVVRYFQVSEQDGAYEVELAACDVEHDYVYEFEAVVRRTTLPAVEVRSAEIGSLPSQTC